MRVFFSSSPVSTASAGGCTLYTIYLYIFYCRGRSRYQSKPQKVQDEKHTSSNAGHEPRSLSSGYFHHSHLSCILFQKGKEIEEEEGKRKRRRPNQIKKKKKTFRALWRESERTFLTALNQVDRGL